jgi:hypothetical protein
VSANKSDFRATVLAQYDSFAVLARSAAAGETLENVRQKHLTSAISWEQLAARGRKMEADRASRAEDQFLPPLRREILAPEPIAPSPASRRSRTLIG